MEYGDKNKFEDIAAHLHENEGAELCDDGDYRAVQRIYSLREKVAQLERLGTVREAQFRVERRMKGRRRALIYRFTRYAAALVILFVTGSALRYWMKNYRETPVFTTVTAAVGEIREVILPDGTKAWLGANSSLQYSDRFGRENRTVRFRGEALFDVAGNQAFPFWIEIAQAVVKVHGTRFVVMEYRQSDKNEIVLLEGEVAYSTCDRNLLMTPGQQLVHHRRTGETCLRSVEIEDYADWTTGKVRLDRERLEDLVVKLEQWYGTEFAFSEESLKDIPFTGTINKLQPLDYILNVISLTNKVKFVEDGDKLAVIKN